MTKQNYRNKTVQTIKKKCCEFYLGNMLLQPNDHYEQISLVNGNCTHLGGNTDYMYQIINKD
jgi:Rieske Fe-S protein